MQQVLDNSFKYDVFICHSSKDKPIIATLIEDLKKENITYWVDAEKINFGDSIIEKITKGLETSKYIIPCVSKNLTASGWTKAEYGSILNAEFSGNSNRIVIPLLLEDCGVKDIPTLLRDKKWVIYSDKTEFSEFVKFLKGNRLKESSTNSLTFSAKDLNNVSQSSNIPRTFKSPSTGMDFILLPSGKFIMGSPSEEQGRYDREGPINEYPIHEVTIKKSFYIGIYTVTQSQWKRILGSSPSSFNGDNLPVEKVSWDDAQRFIKKLNQDEMTNKYRLPSESEWEYACRAGTQTSYYFGDDENTLGEYAWYNGYAREKELSIKGDKILSGKTTHPVGEKKPNPWGLYDMHGNVYEWCQDIYHQNYNNAPSDGSVWEKGNSVSRVIRGGSWYSPASYCRSAVRKNDYSSKRVENIGFRLVRDV